MGSQRVRHNYIAVCKADGFPAACPAASACHLFLHRCCCYPGLLTCLCFFCQLLPTFTVTWGPLGSQSMHRMGILAGICHRDRPSLSFGSLERFWAVCSSFYPSVLSAVYPSKHLPSHSPAHQSSQSIIHPSILLFLLPCV